MKKKPNLEKLFHLLIVCAFGGSLYLIFSGGDLANVGFLIMGSLISFLVPYLSDAIGRPRKQRELAKLIYIELADRAARTYYDYINPWKEYVTHAKDEDSFRIRKFSPEYPEVYHRLIPTMHLLEERSVQAITHFYYRLAALRRDIDSASADAERNGGTIAKGRVALLAKRFQECLLPAATALQELHSVVADHDRIDTAAFSYYRTEEMSSGMLSLNVLLRDAKK